MTQPNTYKLTNRIQLIDLNTDLPNFQADFNVVSEDGKDFHFFVADQTTLDNTEPSDFEFQQSNNGAMAGTLKYDEGEYQNYYLVLKAIEGSITSVIVDLNIQKLEQKPVNSFPEPPPTSSEAPLVIPTKKSSINWKLIILIVVVCVAGYFLYSYFSKKDAAPAPSPFKEENFFPMIGASPEPSMLSSESVAASVAPSMRSASSSVVGGSANLLDRLNSLPMY